MGVFCWPILCRSLIDYFGWRGALLIITGIMLHTIPCAGLLRPVQQSFKKSSSQNTKQSETQRGCISSLSASFDISLFKDKYFLIYVLSIFFIQIGHSVPYVFTPMRAKEYGISPTDGALLLTIIGIPNTIMRLVFGWLGDIKWVDRIWLHGGSCLLAGIGTVCSFYLRTFPLLCVYSIFAGTLGAAHMSLIMPVTVDLVGINTLAPASGMIACILGISMTIGTPISGTYNLTLPY